MENKPLTRNEIVEQVIRLGHLDVYGATQEQFKTEVQDYYQKNKPTIKDFGEYLRLRYGWHGVAVLDDRQSFKPFDFHYNEAGLQYKYRDEQKIIKLECLQWRLVAKIVIEQIKNKTYLQKPSILDTLNSFANNEYKRQNNDKPPKKETER